MKPSDARRGSQPLLTPPSSGSIDTSPEPVRRPASARSFREMRDAVRESRHLTRIARDGEAATAGVLLLSLSVGLLFGLVLPRDIKGEKRGEVFFLFAIRVRLMRTWRSCHPRCAPLATTQHDPKVVCLQCGKSRRVAWRGRGAMHARKNKWLKHEGAFFDKPFDKPSDSSLPPSSLPQAPGAASPPPWAGPPPAAG